MDPATLQQLKQSLLEEKAALEAQLGRIAKPSEDVKGDWDAVMVKPDQSDTNDVKAQSITGYETSRAIEQELEVKLQKVNRALEQIEQGTYGTCVTCGNAIGEDRLKAVPVTQHCMDCQSKRIDA